jgi:GNAT superfamily N-acetyltransferase
MELLIRQLVPTDKENWLVLWRGYLEFYAQELSEEQTELSWERLLNSQDGLNALVAISGEELVGLAHYYWTPSTWTKHKDLYLEDLFVSPSHRKKGVADALIERLRTIASAAGAKKLHGQTHKDNLIARQFYGGLGTQSEFLVYEKELE